ncbi:MAG: hypothetical protein GXY83_27500 [Rhodopirellula sp.]|nr:hypothetical protein [Rhodopirellula sp.]
MAFRQGLKIARLADLDEVVERKGDGAVALKRGGLEGVDDTNVYSFGHVEVLPTPVAGDVKEVHDGVVARLMQHGTSRSFLLPSKTRTISENACRRDGKKTPDP